MVTIYTRLGGLLAGAMVALMICRGAYAQHKTAPRIAEIVVRGNRVLNKAGIVLASGLKVGDLVTPEALDSARTRLLNTGNFGALHPEDAVTIRLADRDRDRNEIKVILDVQENGVVKGFNITGTGPIPVKSVRAQLWTKPGFVLNMNIFRADVKRIQDYYDSKGYLAIVDVNTRQAGVRSFTLPELDYIESPVYAIRSDSLLRYATVKGYVAPVKSFGTKVDDKGSAIPNGILTLPIVVGRIGSIQFPGLSKPRAQAAFRVAGLKPGDYYNFFKLREAANRLIKSGLFKTVEWRPESYTYQVGPMAAPISRPRISVTFRDRATKPIGKESGRTLSTIGHAF